MSKKLFFLFCLFSLITVQYANSQNWTKNLPQNFKANNTLTLSDYQQAFNNYWSSYNVVNGYYYENGVKKKAAGWKQFKRWEYFMESQVNPTTGEFPATTAEEQFNLYYKQNPEQKSATGNWTVLGPSSSDGGYAGVGRINCIAFHPTDLNTYWIGAPAGGIWVTTNNGSTWTCLTNSNATLGVSDIIIPTDYATSNTIYIATGDRDAWDNNSVGVLKSTNGGSTWSITGISYTASQSKMVNRLLTDPNNNNILIAATSNGVYKTTNGGTTWSTQLTSTEFIDMEYKPGDFNTLYGSTQSGDIYVSTNGGTNWTQNMNLASGYRVEIAVSANVATTVYAVVAAYDDGLYGIYKSTNSGGSFSQVFAGTSKNLLGWEADGTDSGGQGWYDLSIAASPTNADILLVGGVNTWKSTNGGTTWTISSHWSGSGVQAVHADKHNLVYRSNGNLFECNDGGVYISTNNGTSWTDKTNGLIISQMYKLSNSKTVQNEVITGLQDNGTKLLSASSWSDVKGGDGMECLIDYSDVNIQYGTYTNGQIDKTTNHWGTATDIQPSGSGDGAWVTPYIIDPVTPATLYAGYSDVWKTTNRGSSWTKISTMNTSEKIRSMAIAPSNVQYLYVADNTTIWKTTNGGTAWTDVTGNLPIGNASIKYIAVKNDDPNTLWVTMSGYTSPGVYQSTTGGTTWINISTGLPTIPCNTIVQNKLNNTTVELYVGTDFGVYFKNGSSNWILFNSGLPNVVIGELEIWYGASTATSKIRAATYGRGLWESDLYYSITNMSYVSSTSTQNNIASIAPNQTNQEILGIEVVTNGSLSPYSATSFSFNTTGSTNPATDITNAKLYYTGGSNVFAATTQFGSTSISPNGTFTFTGTQVLGEGTNYFWLSYDVPATATIGNYLDAQCTSLTVNGVKTPTVTNPTGNRQIGINYCSAGSPATTYEYISKVTMGTIDQTSVRGANGYQDFTAVSTNINIGVSISAIITVTEAYASDQVKIWVDLNRDGDFEDANESVYSSSGSGFTSPHTANFTIPAGTNIGTARLRIRLHDTGNGPNATSCGTASYGEVEDYTLNILPQIPIATSMATAGCGVNSGSVTVSSSLTGSQTFYLCNGTTGAEITSFTGSVTSHTFTSLADGSYKGKVLNNGIMSNLSSAVTITNLPQPVAPTSVNATNLTICAGQSTQLTFSGGSGATFNWYSSSCGGTYVGASNNLTVYPSTTTTYYGRWENTCGSSACQSIVVNVADLTTANAGDDEVSCQTTYIMQANTPSNGTGTWLLTDGAAIIEEVNNPNTQINSLSNFATLKWTISNGQCESFDNVTITLGNQNAITTQPQDVTANTGDNVSFNVVAEGVDLFYQWSFDDEPILNQNSSTLNINSVELSDAGTYYVLVSGTCGTPILSDVVVLSVLTSVEELAKQGINIYPNPSSGLFTISVEGSENPNLTVKISDITGRKILETKNNTFDLTNQTSGIYIIQILTDGKIYNAEIIKH